MVSGVHVEADFNKSTGKEPGTSFSNPLVCGCGVPDVDTDRDGTLSCQEACPNDATKLTPGVSGCGVSDADSDGDGTANCIDPCLYDSKKTVAGICGCGTTDFDSNSNSETDCLSEEALQSKTASLRHQIDTLALKSAARKRKQVKAALTDLEKAIAAFLASGTDVA